MALVREIVEFISNAPDNDFWGTTKLWLDNWEEAVRRPTVTCKDRLEFTPGSFDATVARIALMVKGCTFVRSRDDPMWRPKDADDLIGVRSFVTSFYFHELGFQVEEIDEVQKCREVSMRVVSELLNVRVDVERYLSRPYRDWVNWWFDFRDLRRKLSFGHKGYACENGLWVAREAGENLVGPNTCALAVLESLDEKDARSHFYANYPTELYDSLQTIAKDDGNDEMKRLVSTLYRGCSFRNYRMDKQHVFLLLSKSACASLYRHVSVSKHELAKSPREFYEAFRRAESRWKRDEACYGLCEVAF